MIEFSFSDDVLGIARAIIQSGGCKNILFSQGTYQIEVFDGQETFWPFLQIDDEGKPYDFFCTCTFFEEVGTCPHLSASLMQIFRDHIAPLHVRFRNSLWNKLCIIASRRNVYATSALKKGEKNSLICQSSTGTLLFFIQFLNDKGQGILHKMIYERALETEETSLKFFNISQEELSLWHEGIPSHKLRYELSFWSDLAKWMMINQDNKLEYRIDFRMNIKKVPQGIIITFGDLRIGFSIDEVNWSEIIPTLREVKSPIHIYEFQEVDIHKMIYNESLKSMTIDSVQIRGLRKKIAKVQPDTLSKFGYWRFHQAIGCFPEHIDSLLKMNEIPKESMGTFLERHNKVVERFLVGIKIHHESIKASYILRFDSQNSLCFSCYLFEPGDLQKKNSAFFGLWVYLEKKGFYRIKGVLFNEVETLIPQDKVGSFVEQHQLWLSDYEGFQTHVSNVKSHVIYHLDDERSLSFESEVPFFEDAEGEVIDLGDWIYLKNRGFYHRLSGRGLNPLSSGLKVSKEKISAFINDHKEELDQVKNFFADNSPIKLGGVHIYLNENNQIVVDPQFVFYPGYKGKNVESFGDYVFVKNEGFSEIPMHCKFLEAYPKMTVIEKKSESYFITVELAKLKPFILKLDPKLKIPQSLVINVEKIQKGKGNDWQFNLSYVSELGAENTFTLYEKLNANEPYALTDAGLIFLGNTRFNWLKNLSGDSIINKNKSIRLSTLDWIKVSLFEKVIEPKGNDPDSIQSRNFLEEIRLYRTTDKLNLRNFQSELRPYQKVGVDWLWFLYCHGLSGILCDDMGLGKTHQAMGVLAAVKNFLKTKRCKFIIVCPTSVMYHWEDLLARFLPKAKVHLFYGIQRTLINFRRDSDILLTTYGTMRSEKEALGKINFEVAIYDELQFVKNTRSQTHRSLKMLKAKTRIGLSGTPIENNLYDLKALFDILLPSYFPSTALYRETFVNPIEKYQDQEKKALLSKIIHPFILRRKKQDVLKDLPDKIEEISQCDLLDEQKRLYRETYLKKRTPLVDEIQNKKGGSPFLHVFALLDQLKQICNHPALPLKDVDNYENYESGKWNLFLELVRETRESGQKLVVFSQYLDMLTIIEKYFTKEGVGYAAVRGSTINRRQELDRFKNDPECEVFIASLKAIGVGVDLVAASVVIHYDRWWNPAKENQATDRVHRIGQNRGVQVFKLVTKGTIEEHIHHLIEKKKKLSDGIIGYDDQDQIKKLNHDEVMDLFKKINKDLQNM